MHLGLGGHVTLKWGMESELFQLNQLLYIISYIFFTLFMPKSEAQLKKKLWYATALEVTSSIPAGSFTIYKFIDEVFYLSKTLFGKFLCGIQNQFLIGDNSGNRM